VSCTAKALHSAAVFLLRSPQRDYIWKGNTHSLSNIFLSLLVVGYNVTDYSGKQSADYELKYAQELSIHQKREWIVLEEGHEMSDFWNLLGTKVNLPNLGYPSSYDRRKIPRLFKCSVAPGEFQESKKQLSRSSLPFLTTFLCLSSPLCVRSFTIYNIIAIFM
jgi:hypothetical protein